MRPIPHPIYNNSISISTPLRRHWIETLQDDHIIKKRGTGCARSSQGTVLETLRGARQRSVPSPSIDLVVTGADLHAHHTTYALIKTALHGLPARRCRFR